MTKTRKVSYKGTVGHVIDGDSFTLVIKGWPAYFSPWEVRVQGIDTPEHEFPPAQCIEETALGKQATVVAKTLLKPGDLVTVIWDGKSREKYGRLLGAVRLADGRDYGALMIAAGVARAYNGGFKAPWVAAPAA